VADERLTLELDTRRGEPVRVEWDLAALAGVGAPEPSERPFTIEGGFEASRWDLARVLSGAFADGRLLAVAALRPTDARGHGEEEIAGALVRDGEAAMLDEVLLSVEYGPDREPRRLGLEVYERPDSLPLRIAGDRSGPSKPDDARFELRSDGVEGAGSLVVLRPS